MATSESEIRMMVLLLLKQYGSLNTKQVKKLLHTVMVFDEEDMQLSLSRTGEAKIAQKIGNIISHQSVDVRTYYNSYIIDKTVYPAVWSILTGLESQNTLNKISNEETVERKRVQRQRYFKPRKIDWAKLNEHRTDLGLLGEEFAMKHEKERVSCFASEDVNRVIHVSKELGDGAGFDILSIDEDGNDIYIEVKTTEGRIDAPFYMTANEYYFFDINKYENNSFIYRIYDFNKENNEGKVHVISAKDLFLQYGFDSMSYKVSRLD
ncbi:MULTISPECIES: DUF3883 domain-containing protein [unclassified Psychrobacter]|uniref:DUF3883 domain-containing protein n=1 Tax=unclassified Psychrobacter TaxID=196806 RepID=UPI0015978131|nr:MULTISPECIES: DUF3883 domain-containing protein [unclassified Psychrobacter]MDA5134538.1 DUF3883 domain-containing protein [Psychrobacter sp. ANT_H3]QJS05673.1 hypothetical protein [Psychrobacter sp.]